ncbi:PIN-like domain-containing protein [Xenorhabdus szentirmaii]|uniref:PIN-like domain-containing protein n=1 Tax=Xenorhabdus szentirmaii TaxID=290112 RepID=UPI0019B97587|nr:PIN-like domain-containing protein [Xenorhabdus sp. 5]MBD2823513.1 hypothetical protein [Xenorhabdus sp. 5]
MKTLFQGYQSSSLELTVKEIKKSNIYFDTSALLNLYRYTKKSTDEFIKAISYFENNIWLPYIVALEYQTNRIKVLKQQTKIFNDLLTRSQKFKDEILGLFSGREHHSIEYRKISNLIDGFKSEFDEYIIESEKNHPDYIINDPIQNKIMNIFDKKTGSIPSSDYLEKAYKEAESRFEYNIPPGFKDKKNKENEFKTYGDLVIKSKYSDFLIWKEIINHAEKEKKMVILVTDDRKEDWCRIENGFILGPRPELITELMQKSKVDFKLVSSSKFIKITSQIRGMNISKDTIHDIEQSLLPSWKDIILQAFQEIGPEVKLNELYEWINKNPPRPLTQNWEVTARKTIYYYCKDRNLFLGKEELFEALDDATYRLK